MFRTYTSSDVLYGVEKLSDPKSTELFNSVQNQMLKIQKQNEPVESVKTLTPKGNVRVVSVEDALKELRDLGITS